MDLSKAESFQVIGRCSKMQTFTWGEEFSLLDGIPYDIYFFQDFSKLYLNGLLLTDIPVANLIKSIDYLTSKTVSPSAGYFPQKENDRYGSESSSIDWDLVSKKVRKEIKQEEKWKKAHRKIKPKDANYNFDLICEDLLGDLYYE